MIKKITDKMKREQKTGKYTDPKDCDCGHYFQGCDHKRCPECLEIKYDWALYCNNCDRCICCCRGKSKDCINFWQHEDLHYTIFGAY